MAPVKVSRKTPREFEINVAIPANDGIFDIKQYETFLSDRVKVEGRTKNLSNSVTITLKSAHVVTFTVQPNVQFPKRYIKYLTKKFLKKNLLRDYIRVVANSKTGYELRYFKIDDDAEEEEEEAEE